jgi:hypothetical protein
MGGNTHKHARSLTDECGGNGRLRGNTHAHTHSLSHTHTHRRMRRRREAGGLSGGCGTMRRRRSRWVLPAQFGHAGTVCRNGSRSALCSSWHANTRMNARIQEMCTYKHIHNRGAAFCLSLSLSHACTHTHTHTHRHRHTHTHTQTHTRTHTHTHTHTHAHAHAHDASG